jgi:hypothetical protein
MSATLHLRVKKRFQKYQFFAGKSRLSTEMKFAGGWKSIKEGKNPQSTKPRPVQLHTLELVTPAARPQARER